MTGLAATDGHAPAYMDGTCGGTYCHGDATPEWTGGTDEAKRINKRLAKAALGATRGTDLVFRWGGDEILVLLAPTVREGALRKM